MKSVIRMALAVSAGGMMLSSTAMATLALEPGSLAIAFYRTNSGGSAIGDTYIYDLGQASLYRDPTNGAVSVSSINTTLSANIGADLVSAFGANWADAGDVRWTIVGGVGPSDSAINDDVARTSYFSRANNSYVLGMVGSGSSIANVSETNLGFMSTNIDSFFAATDGRGTTGANPDGVFIPSSLANTVDDYFSGGLYFGVGIDPRQLFGAGDIGGVEGALDLYRIPTNDFGSSVGQFVGTFTIDGAGNLAFTNAVPEPSSALLIGLAGGAFLVRRKRASLKHA